MMLMMVIPAPLMAVGGVILALSQDAQLAWVLLGVMPIMAVVFFIIMRKAVPLSTAMQVKIDRLNLVLGEGLSGIRVIRAFDRGAHQRERFDEANLDVTETAIAVNRLISILMPALILMLNLTGLAIIWVGSHRIDQGDMQVGAMIASLQYAFQILFAVFMVTAMFVMLPRAEASAARINEVLDLEPEISDPAAPAAAAPPAPPRGRVQFENVTFQSHGAEEPALSGISFTANPGEVTAIIGGTGSGKSTLAGLIPRFYDVSAGRITIDGADIRDISLSSLRSQVGTALQEAVLFSGTVRDNIRYGRPGATEEEVRDAARAAQAHDFIAGLPQGYDTEVGQRGVNLSGGQKQRIAIARALLVRPRILVLDDSTSAVDVETEARIQEELRVLMKGRTCFIVAQRISTVLAADTIIVLERGRMAAMGTHGRLLATSPLYREIYDSQLGGGPGADGARDGGRGAPETDGDERAAPGGDHV
ncbi:MAG TPA: ABC transporter ATP-binding protein, partial [Spirochaetia bacterium]